jgi:hypothetical protein
MAQSLSEFCAVGGMQRYVDDDVKPKQGDATPEKVEDDYATIH